MWQTILHQPLFVLFAVISLGIALGNIQIKGLSLGLSGVIFTALAAGHFQLNIPAGIGNMGLVLFVYCVGLSAGNRFFSALAKQGSKLAFLTLIIVGCGAACTCLLGIMFGIPAGISSGIFAGSLTSTPALAAAMEALTGNTSGVSIGYGIAYPFGVVGVVLFVQLMPRFLKFDWSKEEPASPHERSKSIVSRLVRVTHDRLNNKNIADYDILEGLKCKITRIAKDGRLVPLSHSDIFEQGQELLIVGREDCLPAAAAFLGEICSNPYPMDTSRERRDLILTSQGYSGKTLRELDPLKNDHIIISRVSRLGFTFIPTADTTMERNDILTVVGTTDNIERFAQKIGHRSTAMNATDLFSLGAGLSIGILLGMVQIALPGGAGISLGIAGGPLIAALILDSVDNYSSQIRMPMK